ncbi:MAG: glycosyltransferase family 2 protein [Patescibacteria group bacterium]
MKLSIIILDFEKSTRVLENVAALLRQKTSFDFEIVIAVNAANPEKKIRFAAITDSPKIKFIFNTENLGYPRGINAAVQNSTGQILAIINPDIVCRDHSSLQKLVAKIDNDPQIGVLAPRQRNDSDGSVALTIRAFPKLSNQIARRTFFRRLPILRARVEFDEMRHLDLEREQKVDWIQSSFWLVRRNLWDELGGLDERFFLFMSDPDFCRRVWETGKKVVFWPAVEVAADGVRCSAGGFLAFFKKWTLRQHLRDALKYSRKWLGRPSPR